MLLGDGNNANRGVYVYVIFPFFFFFFLNHNQELLAHMSDGNNVTGGQGWQYGTVQKKYRNSDGLKISYRNFVPYLKNRTVLVR